MMRLPWVIRGFFYSLFFSKIKFPCYIGPPIFLRGLRAVSIGSNARIFPGLRLEAFDGGSVVFADNVSIAQNVHITSAGSELVISSGVTILANTFVTNIDHCYEDVKMSPSKQNIKKSITYIGENCFIGMGVAIQAGTILGDHCIVGANSVVRGTFPDYSVIGGVPAKVLKKYNFDTGQWVKC